tara:strand:- start:114 stop:722 length:609 start_codon:yes stop_codon:yes gene_type:complete
MTHFFIVQLRQYSFVSFFKHLIINNMKTIIVILVFIPFYFFGQIEVVESIKLDSLIFNKINEYRKTKGVDDFEAFEDSLMRDFSYQLTRENSKKTMIEHSKENKFEVYNAECIYSHRINCSSIERIQDYKNMELNYWADKAVKGWINSPSHELAISYKYYKVATVTTRIEFNKNTSEVFFVASFHALINDQYATISNYVYKR